MSLYSVLTSKIKFFFWYKRNMQNNKISQNAYFEVVGFFEKRKCLWEGKDLQTVSQGKPDDRHLDFEGEGEGERVQSPDLKAGFAEGFRQGEQVWESTGNGGSGPGLSLNKWQSLEASRQSLVSYHLYHHCGSLRLNNFSLANENFPFTAMGTSLGSQPTKVTLYDPTLCWPTSKPLHVNTMLLNDGGHLPSPSTAKETLMDPDMMKLILLQYESFLEKQKYSTQM